MSSNEKKISVSLIITIAAAVLAAAAVVMLLVTMNKGGEPSEPDEPVIPGFTATQELADECIGAAQKLVGDNYEIIRLFVTEGLPLKKVYGNEAEALGGYYQIDSPKYTEFSQIETVVKSVYGDSEANRILMNLEVNTKDGTPGKLEVYRQCKINGADFFGLNEQFAVEADYDTDWSSCYVEIQPRSETECGITVYLDGVTSETAAQHADSVRKTSMTKTADGWRLTVFLK